MNQKELLIQKGTELFSKQSYNATGIRALTKAVGIPTGSFHYHFKNKEEFALTILDRWLHKEFMPISNSILFDLKTNSKQKLIKYFKVMIDYHEEQSAKYGSTSSCMMGNMGSELANESGLIMDKIRQMYKAIIFGIKTLINLGHVDGSISREVKASIMAPFIFDAYEGALIRRKIEQSNKPVEDFLNTMDSLL